MKGSFVPLLAFASAEAENRWASADFPDQKGPVHVPNNRWGGNSKENVYYEPRKEKSPVDLKFFVKSQPGNAFFVPNSFEVADWVEKFSEEFDTNEVATNFTDADGNRIYNRKMNVFNSDYWEFAQTDTERENNWVRGVNSCGAHRELDQQDDVNCPNVIVINTDDMSWADLSVNNPSKLIPTPNLDRLVSKGINFRDGHSCTARCAPSRYCLMTGRHSWRRGDYHYKPMYLEHGRKIIPQMFKRAGYRTYLVGKAQPTEAKITKIFSIDHYTECRVTQSDEFGSEEANEERRRRRQATDFQRLVYNGGAYDPAVNDYMYMDVGEDGEAMDNTAQRVCWFGADVLLRNECEESWKCLPKRFNAAAYATCIDQCMAQAISRGDDAKYQEIQDTSCPSRQGFCDPDNTDYKNFALQEGVLKWGYDTGFNSFSYCCYPGAAFFRDDYNIESLRSYGIYVDIRDDAHMYNDNLRIRDDWISKNMQYIIGRSGLFKHFQGESFRPWSGAGYPILDRYTKLTVERTTGEPCSDLSEENQCSEPEEVSQCDWFDSLEDTLRTAKDNRPDEVVQFFNDETFGDMLQALEASFFTMTRNETVALNKFQFVERIIVENNSLLSSRKRTEQEIADSMINVMGPWPDHDGGEFKKIDPTFTVQFFKNYANRGATSKEKNERRREVESYIMDLVANMLARIDLIRDIELKCDDRRKRDTSVNLRPQPQAGNTSFNPAVAMKFIVRGNIKSMDQEIIRPNLNATEFQQLRENYEFSSNMYKFIYSANSADIIEAPYGAEGKPRHFHSKAEAKAFVDRVADAFLQYQGIEALGTVNPENGLKTYTDDQRARFKLWEWAHTKKYGGYGFNSPRTQPSFDSREVMKNFHEEASKNFVEAKHHIAEKNQPFFMYLAFRAPHRPFSHIEEYDYARPGGFIGKAGEQIREFDDRIGMLMKTLEDLNIADNTFVMFTSDNGPDGSGFANQDFQGHVRFGTLRGKKASVFEGGHRVPFLVWWPKGTDQSLWGSNYDLPVGQLDLFATFADMIKYPLPSAEKCSYSFDTTNPPIRTNKKNRSLAEIKREQAWVHAEASKYPDLIVNDKSAFWSIETLRTKCTSDDSDCPCDNWTNENNPDFNKTISNICYHRTFEPWKAHNLGVCHCKPIEKDCPEGYCFSRILPGSTKEDMTEITGGRHAINNLFYRTNEDGSSSYVGPWDTMSDDERRDFRRGLESVHMYHQFLTLEEKTGLVLGFDGCMAEDSHSFLDAFKASDESKNTGKFHRRPAEIFGGKLGDISLRMGRYKLVRWNPPKDRRTGPNAQHLRPNNEAEWPRDPNGGKTDKEKPENWQDQSLYQHCTWAPVYTEDMENPYLSNLVMERKNVPKNHTDNQRWMCQKDHFYELWDLNINPGERQLCNSEYNVDVWESMREQGSFQAADNPREDGFDVLSARGLGGNTINTDYLYGKKLQDGKPEKHPDPHGIGSGKESTPVPDYVTDCCLVDYGNLEDRPCRNSESDVCVKPRNEPIDSAAEILKVNAKKAARWMEKRANVIELLKTFPDDFKDYFASVDREGRDQYWTDKFNAAEPIFEDDFNQELAEATDLRENRRLYMARSRNFENLPIFDETEGARSDDPCLVFAALRVQRTVRGADRLTDARLTDIIASDSFLECKRSNSDFKLNEDGSYKMFFNMKFSRFLFPKSTNIDDYSMEYFENLAECTDVDCLLSNIDNMLDIEHRHDANNNMKMDPAEVVEQFNKRILIKGGISTMSTYEPFCPRGCVNSASCKCPVNSAIGGRKRRNTSPNPMSSSAIIPRANKSILRRSSRSALPPMNNMYYLKPEHVLWVMDKFEPKLSTFSSWAAENYEVGYRCAESPLLSPRQYTRLDIPDIRGRFCKPKAEEDTLKCKVPEHSGSVGNGFKIVDSAEDAVRFPGAEEAIEIKGFGAYAKFAKCMADVMLEIEGAAHYPELDEKLKAFAGQEDTALWRQEAKDENYQFSGLRNGLNPRSLQSKASNVRGINSSSPYMANEPAGVESQYLHGGGSRYIQPNNDDYYVNGCLKYLEEAGLPSAYTVPGSNIPGSQKEDHTVNSILNTENAGDGPGSLDYDMDASLLGYYPLKKMPRLDGKCVMVPRWLPEREANFVKYGIVEC